MSMLDPEETPLMLMPRQPVPPLVVPTLDGAPYDLAHTAPERFSLVVFYRGYHCPICAKYLMELGRLLPEYANRGVEVIAISSDTEERARLMQQKVGHPALRMGYALPLAVARQWGLYISRTKGKTSIGIEEPTIFSEPAVYLVRPDRTLYYGAVQTMPFARPHFDELLPSIDFSIQRNYPARGEYAGPLEPATVDAVS